MKLLKFFAIFWLITVLYSCTNAEKKDFNLKKDLCENCKMAITNLDYAAQIVTEEGRVYKFDDLSCMTMYEDYENSGFENAKKYVIDMPTANLVNLENAYLIKGGTIKSPMGGNTLAFRNKIEALKAAKILKANLLK